MESSEDQPTDILTASGHTIRERLNIKTSTSGVATFEITVECIYDPYDERAAETRMQAKDRRDQLQIESYRRKREIEATIQAFAK